MAHRFQTLDGMRGVAALFVLVGHSPEFFGLHHVPRFWLAVDLFFLLSGFVLSHTYEPRFAKGMGVREFATARIIRLYPLYLLGTALGIASAAAVLMAGRGDLGALPFAVSGIAAAAMLPSPLGDGYLFPFNFPAWSLFVELVANVVFVVAWPRLTGRVLAAWVVASGCLLLFFSPGGVVFGGTSWGSLPWGLLRIGFSFFLGVLLARHHPGTRWRSELAWIAPLVTGALLVLPLPDLGGLGDGLMVTLLFPALLWGAALVEPLRARPFALLGQASYPIYALHVPIIACCWRGLLFVHRTPADVAPLLGVALMIGIVPLALLLDRGFDTPVRRRLTQRLAARPRLARSLTSLDTPL